MKRILIIIIVYSLLLSGCGGGSGIRSNFRDIAKLQIVQTIGLDHSGEDELKVTVAGGKPADGSAPYLVSRSGRSFLEAFGSVQDMGSDRQVFFPHTRYILLSEDYARSSIAQVLDFVQRDVRLRMGTELFVLRGADAEELMSSSPGGYNITQLLDTVKRDVNYKGDSRVFSVRETVRSLNESGSALICALRPADTEGSVFNIESGLVAVPDGYGILRGAELAGFISSRDAVAVGLLTGHMGTFAISARDERGGSVTLETTGGKANIQPRWTAEGALELIELELSLSAAVAEIDEPGRRLETADSARYLEEQLARDMEKRVLSVLDSSSRMDADFLNLSGLLRRDSPENFDALDPNWLKEAVFSVSAQARIDRSYDLGDPSISDRSEK